MKISNIIAEKVWCCNGNNVFLLLFKFGFKHLVSKKKTHACYPAQALAHHKGSPNQTGIQGQPGEEVCATPSRLKTAEQIVTKKNKKNRELLQNPAELQILRLQWPKLQRSQPAISSRPPLFSLGFLTSTLERLQSVSQTLQQPSASVDMRYFCLKK